MDTYEATEGALPIWTGWALLFAACAGVVALTVISGYFGSFIALRPVRALGPDAPWQERARVAYPARVFSGAFAVLPAALTFGVAVSVADLAMTVPRWIVLTLLVAAAAIPGFRARLVMERAIRRAAIPFGRWLRGGFVLVLLMMPHILVALGVGLLMPSQIDARAITTLAAGAAFTFYLVRGGVLDVVRLARLGRAAQPRLAAIVARTAEKAGVKPRAIVELCLPWANAYAYPLSARLAFTDEALATLSDEELGAVCAHELGHLAEPKSVAAARLAGVFAFFFPLAIARPLLASSGPKAFGIAILASYVGAIALRIVFVRLFQRLEARADKVAHEHEGDAGTYARALTRIYEVNLMPVVMPKGRGVHPSLYDRVAAAGAPMESPRPEPPPRARAFAALGVSLLVLVAGLVGGIQGLGALLDFMLERL